MKLSAKLSYGSMLTLDSYMYVKAMKITGFLNQKMVSQVGDYRLYTYIHMICIA